MSYNSTDALVTERSHIKKYRTSWLLNNVDILPRSHYLSPTCSIKKLITRCHLSDFPSIDNILPYLPHQFFIGFINLPNMVHRDHMVSLVLGLSHNDLGSYSNTLHRKLLRIHQKSIVPVCHRFYYGSDYIHLLYQ